MSKTADRPRTQRRIARPLANGFVGDNLAQDLRAHAARTPAHERVQSERRLARDYGISHSTVRRVVEGLVQEGLFYKVHGKGIFVAEQAKPAAAKPRTIFYVDDWPDMEHAFCVRKLRGILEGAQRFRFRVQVYNQEAPGQAAIHNQALLEELPGEDVGGIIVSWLTTQVYQEIQSLHPGLAIVATHSVLPEENVACVIQDWFAAGYQAVRYLAGRNGQRVGVLHRKGTFVDGAKQAVSGPEAKGVELVLREIELQDDPVVAARHILAEDVEGLAFDDDRVALQVLRALEAERPGALQTVPVITVANVGEDIFPPQVARLDIDGYEVGTVAVDTLRALMDGLPQGKTVIHIKPTLVEPAGLQTDKG